MQFQTFPYWMETFLYAPECINLNPIVWSSIKMDVKKNLGFLAFPRNKRQIKLDASGCGETRQWQHHAVGTLSLQKGKLNVDEQPSSRKITGNVKAEAKMGWFG